MQEQKKDAIIDFISGWGYGFCFGNAINYLLTKEYLKAEAFTRLGIESGEIGFKKLGKVSIHTLVSTADVPDEIKKTITTLHKGIHMKQEPYLHEAYAMLVDYLDSSDTETNGERSNGSREDSAGLKQHAQKKRSRTDSSKAVE